MIIYIYKKYKVLNFYILSFKAMFKTLGLPSLLYGIGKTAIISVQCRKCVSFLFFLRIWSSSMSSVFSPDYEGQS